MKKKRKKERKAEETKYSYIMNCLYASRISPSATLMSNSMDDSDLITISFVKIHHYPFAFGVSLLWIHIGFIWISILVIQNLWAWTEKKKDEKQIHHLTVLNRCKHLKSIFGRWNASSQLEWNEWLRVYGFMRVWVYKLKNIVNRSCISGISFQWIFKWFLCSPFEEGEFSIVRVNRECACLVELVSFHFVSFRFVCMYLFHIFPSNTSPSSSSLIIFITTEQTHITKLNGKEGKEKKRKKKIFRCQSQLQTKRLQTCM